ncbi:MAG: glutamyl-tRNA amidotransferase [Anaerolinea sp.]|nr:glutamyl-tRNA amidotransferase [Anaerolinea sp.]
MELKPRLESDLHDAMRNGDDVKKSSIRMVLAAIKLAQVDKGGPLDDQAILALLQKEIKSRKESISDAEKANRPDLITAAQAEIAILEGYLPAQMPAEELAGLVQAAIQEAGASLPSDMGRVMKLLLPRVQGRAANDQVSQLVRQLLEKK